MLISPWTITPEAASEIETIKAQDTEDADARALKCLIDYYHFKQPYIGRTIILDPDHPDFDPELLEI